MKTSKKKNIAILIVILLMVYPVFAQDKVVEGKVTTYKKIALKSAKVTVKKTKEMTFTDSLGYFKLKCGGKDKLVVSAKGFKSKIVKVKNSENPVKINLEVDGEESDLDLAFANGHINSKELKKAKVLFNTVQPYSFGFSNIVELLKNKFPNANVSDEGVIIRGYNTSSEVTSNYALIVLNGVLINFETLKSLNLMEIKNIRMLHGAAATRFGSGSSNGVVSVELLQK
ncbi:carboxypeptidase-like regulatory domain-containing protein [Aureibaculum conchae]|uniref:carboxypeptidase-like regulatory domain-containing protein n=1 Tax=Aureibaculum sp. 2308TA14-22 TaxID=3108392 RepID=UPI003396B250